MLSEQLSAPQRASSTLPDDATASAATVYGRSSSDPRVIVADGRNVQVRVERGHLSILDGLGQHRRTRTLPRIERTVRRIIILADHGYITWDAARWCADVGIVLVQADRSGRLVNMTAAPEPDDAGLRRAQAFASEDGPYATVGLDIVKYLLARKLDGQATIAAEYLNNPTAARIIRDHAAQLPDSKDVATARGWEATAGKTYWQAWEGRVIVPFDPREAMKVPAHWTTFTARKSPIDTAKGNAHHAADPINALLNYAYRLAEIEARLACLAVGLDPAMGLHHADKPGRDSFALDLVEILRPEVDRFMLDLLCTNGPMRYLSPKLFAEQSDGACRLVPPITHLLAEQAVSWAQVIAPHADHVARMLARIGNGEITRSTRITDDDQPPKTGPRRKPAQPLRLPGTVTVERIIPDNLWATLGPAVANDTPRKHTGRPPRDNRAALAGIVCVEHLGCSWGKLPLTLGISTNTCKRRLNTWRRDGTWTAVKRILDNHDHIRQLRTETHKVAV